MALHVLLVAERGRDFTAIRGLLAEAGLEVELDWVTTGEAARAALATQHHELCLVALRAGHRGTPDILVADDLGPPAPIIVLTSGAGRVEEDLLMQAGAADVIDRDTLVIAEFERSLRHALWRAGRVRRLRDRAVRLGTTTDLAPIGLVYVDREGRLAFANRRANAWFGRGARDLAGHRIDEVFGQDYVRLAPHVEAALAGRSATVDCELGLGDLGLRRVRLRTVPDTDARGQTLGFVMHAEDVSGPGEDIGLSTAEERLRDFALAARDWQWETDAEHRLIYLSEAAGARLGLDAARLLGRAPRNGLDAEDDEDAATLASDMAAGRPLGGLVLSYRDEHQAMRSVLLTGRPLVGADEDFRGYRGMGRDVTAETRAAVVEFESLDRIAGPASASRTRHAFGQGGLEETMPEVFAELVADYGAELERLAAAAEDRPLSSATPVLHDLVQRLGFLRASARDMIRLHRAALAARLKLAKPDRTRRMLDHGRLTLIAALTLLVTQFRAGAAGDRPEGLVAGAKR